MKNKKWIYSLIGVLLCLIVAFLFYRNSIDTATFTAAEEPGERIDSETEKKIVTVTEDEMIPITTNVSPTVDWEYSFTNALDPNSVVSANIIVLNNEEEEMKVSISLVDDGKTIRISPPEEGYKEGEEYLLAIENIKYTDGTDVSSPYEELLVIDREEVEDIKLKESIINTSTEDVISHDEESLVVSENVSPAIEVGDIIVIPTNSNPVGKALKVKGVKKERNRYVIETERPEFFELFDELDIHKTYEVTTKNVELTDGLEGVSISENTSYHSKGKVAAANTKDKNREEYIKKNKKKKGPSLELEHRDNGVNIEFEDFEIGKDFVLSGELDFGTDIDVDLRILPYIKGTMLVQNHMNSEAILELKKVDKDSTKKYDIRKGKLKKKEVVRKKIGGINIPTSAPGVFIEGDINLVVEWRIDAEPIVFFEFDYIEETGLHIKGKNVTMSSDNNLDVNAGIKGNGIGEFKTGPAIFVGISALEVLGAGVEGLTGGKAKGLVTAGLDYENGLYACAKGEANLFVNASVIVDTLGEKILFQKSSPDLDLPPKLTLGNCNHYNVFEAAPNKVSLRNGESKQLQITAGYTDLITLDEVITSLKDFNDVSWELTDKDVVEVQELTSNGTTRLYVKVIERPMKPKTKLKITYKVPDTLTGVTALGTRKDMSKVEVVVPIEIMDFKKPEKLSESEIKTLVRSHYKNIFRILKERADIYSKESRNSSSYPEIDAAPVMEALSGLVTEGFFDKYIKNDLAGYFIGKETYLPSFLHTNTRFSITENTLNNFKINTVSAGTTYLGPITISISGTFKDGKWLFSDLTYVTGNLNLTKQEAINFVKYDYDGGGSYTYVNEVNLPLVEGEEKKKIYVFQDTQGNKFGIIADTSAEQREYVSPSGDSGWDFERGPYQILVEPEASSPLTKEQAIDLVKEHLDVSDSSSIEFEYNYTNENGHWVFWAFQMVIDDPDSGAGHANTYGYFAVNQETKEVYNMKDAQ